MKILFAMVYVGIAVEAIFRVIKYANRLSLITVHPPTLMLNIGSVIAVSSIIGMFCSMLLKVILNKYMDSYLTDFAGFLVCITLVVRYCWTYIRKQG